MKNREVSGKIATIETFKEVGGSVDSYEFVKRLLDIHRVLTAEQATIDEMKPKQSAAFQDYVKRVQAVANEYRVMDAMGNPTNNFKEPAEMKAKVDLISEECKDCIDEFETNNKVFDEFMNKESTLEISLIPEKYRPASLTFGQMLDIEQFIERK